MHRLFGEAHHWALPTDSHCKIHLGGPGAHLRFWSLDAQASAVTCPFSMGFTGVAIMLLATRTIQFALVAGYGGYGTPSSAAPSLRPAQRT